MSAFNKVNRLFFVYIQDEKTVTEKQVEYIFYLMKKNRINPFQTRGEIEKWVSRQQAQEIIHELLTKGNFAIEKKKRRKPSTSTS